MAMIRSQANSRRRLLQSLKAKKGKPPKIPKESKSTPTKKIKYVPQKTDTDANMETPPATPPRRNSAPTQITPPPVSRRKSAPSRVVLTDTPMTPPRRKSSPKNCETEIGDDSPMHISTRPNIRPRSDHAAPKVSPRAVQDDLEEKSLLPVIDDASNQYVDEAMNAIVNDKFRGSKKRKSVKSTSVYSNTKLTEKIDRMRRKAQDKKRNAARKAYEFVKNPLFKDMKREEKELIAQKMAEHATEKIN